MVGAAPLSWPAQVAAHAAWVEAHPARYQPPPEGPGRGRTRSGLRARCTQAPADRKRETLLEALRDGRPHLFRDMRAALPGASYQGITYLLESLACAGRITITDINNTRRAYQLVKEPSCPTAP